MRVVPFHCALRCVAASPPPAPTPSSNDPSNPSSAPAPRAAARKARRWITRSVAFAAAGGCSSWGSKGHNCSCRKSPPSTAIPTRWRLTCRPGSWLAASPSAAGSSPMAAQSASRHRRPCGRSSRARRWRCWLWLSDAPAAEPERGIGLTVEVWLRVVSAGHLPP